MSKATKRKHVFGEVLSEYVLPEDNQQIVKVFAPRGNNLHEVEAPGGDKFLVSMPSKFRKNVWIKRGDFVIVDPISEGDKVKGEIAVILYPSQIRYIKQEGKWPVEYLEKTAESETLPLTNGGEMKLCGSDGEESDEYSSDDDDDLFVNTNRPNIVYEESDDSSDEDEEESDEGFVKDEEENDHQNDGDRADTQDEEGIDK